MTGFITVSIKDNYLLLSPKLRRKETSGDVHQENTMGPRERVEEGPVPRRKTWVGRGWSETSLSRKWLPGNQPGMGRSSYMPTAARGEDGSQPHLLLFVSQPRTAWSSNPIQLHFGEII